MWYSKMLVLLVEKRLNLTDLAGIIWQLPIMGLLNTLRDTSHNLRFHPYTSPHKSTTIFLVIPTLMPEFVLSPQTLLSLACTETRHWRSGPPHPCLLQTSLCDCTLQNNYM